MSQENVELVQRFYAMAAERRMAELRWAYTPDFKLREERSMPEAETLYGPEAMEQWARKWAAMFDYTYLPREIHDAGERVLVEAVVHTRGKQSGVETETTVYSVWTLRDGRFASQESFLDRAAPFEVAGLGG